MQLNNTAAFHNAALMVSCSEAGTNLHIVRFQSRYRGVSKENQINRTMKIQFFILTLQQLLPHLDGVRAWLEQSECT